MKDKIKKLKAKIGENKTNIVIITTLIAIMFLFCGLSLAFYAINVGGTGNNSSVTVTGAIKTLTITDNEDITYSNIYPGWTASKTFTVTNTGNIPVVYKLLWEEMTNSFTRTDDLKYTITSTNIGARVSQTSLPTTGTNIEIQNSILISPNVTQTYTVTFEYLNLSDVNQDADIGKSFSSIIDIDEGTVTFRSQIFANTPPTTVLTTTPGQEVATTEEGLIEGPDDDYGNTTYYYRGVVTNNYVSFGEYQDQQSFIYQWEEWNYETLQACIDGSVNGGYTETEAEEICLRVIVLGHDIGDPMIWRIIRINGDGTVRMILDDFIGYTGWNDDTSPDTAAEAITEVTYGTSIIKTVVDTWYNANIGNNATLSSKVATTKFCNDRTGTINDSGDQFFGSANRLQGGSEWNVANAAPIMTCPDTNNIYNLSVGLITADEMAFAGAVYDTSNPSYYLYNSNLSDRWWTISPMVWDYYTYMYIMDYFSGHQIYGSLDNTGIDSIIGVRPVISLKSNVTATGTGTSADPYVIQ